MRPQIEQPQNWKWRVEPTGPAKPGNTRGLTGTVPGLAWEEAEGRVSGRVCNRTKSFFQAKHSLLACHPDPLLTLGFGV